MRLSAQRPETPLTTPPVLVALERSSARAVQLQQSHMRHGKPMSRQAQPSRTTLSESSQEIAIIGSLLGKPRKIPCTLAEARRAPQKTPAEASKNTCEKQIFSERLREGCAPEMVTPLVMSKGTWHPIC